MTAASPVPAPVVRKHLLGHGLDPVGRSSIRELKRLINDIEAESGVRYIRMEMGIPGLPPPEPAVEAEVNALKRGVSAVYPPFDGIPELKTEISGFIRNFLDVDVDPVGCFPTVGAMHGCYLGMMVAGSRDPDRNRLLFIDPGFPVNKLQARMLGLVPEQFDVYDFRGERLKSRLESVLASGTVAAVIYSSPNNPSWICLTEEELETVGRLCRRYDVIVLEDLAYIGMDFRKDYSAPGTPPFVPTVARYTDQYVLIISSSKAFSLAGQRIGMAAVADTLFHREFDGLEQRFGTRVFGRAFIFGGIYGTTAGVAHSTQYGLLGILTAVNRGEYNFVEAVREYGDRARTMKRIFLDHGFRLVYEKDVDTPIADGFYFTVSYPGFTGDELVEELLYYGVSAISLSTTGSSRNDGIRACVSLTGPDRFSELEERLEQFDRDHQSGLQRFSGSVSRD